jgi:hypothetical protein
MRFLGSPTVRVNGVDVEPGAEERRDSPLVDEGEGVLIGNGDGTVAGRALNGALRWTLFEQPGEFVCAMSPTLRIDTSDGAQIRADGRGFAARDGREAREWRVAATLSFRTDDARYAWLDGALGLWEGEFDAERHRAYLQRTLSGRGRLTTTDGTEALTAVAIPPERWGLSGSPL